MYWYIAITSRIFHLKLSISIFIFFCTWHWKLAHWLSTKWQCRYSYEVFVPRTCKHSLCNRIRKTEPIQRANTASPPHVRRLRMNHQWNECIWADPGTLFQPANQRGHQGIRLLQFSYLPSLALRLRGYLFITWWMQSHSKAQTSQPHGATSEASRTVSPTWPLSSTQLFQKHFGSRRPFFTA